MEIEKLKIEKLVDLYNSNEIPETDKEAIYCEIQYKRDRSSFAGIAFKFIEEKNVITVRSVKERIICNVSIYEKMYMGCELDYIDCIKEVFSLEKRKYGLEILFLIYSDVRSSQIIFEELISRVDKNIDRIKNLF